MADFTESFNKTDGDGLGPDLTWTLTDPGSDWATSSNQGILDSATTSGEPIARAEHDTGSSDMYCQIVIPDFGTSSYCDIGLCVRVSADRQTRYTFKRMVNASGPGYEIRKYVSGTMTALVINDGSPAFAFPETLRIEVEGSTIRVLRNGVELTSTTDTDISSGSFGGLDGFRNNNNASRRVIFDSFATGSLSAPVKVVPIGQPVESNKAQRLARIVARTTSSETAHAMTARKIKSVGLIVEADQAFAVTRPGVILTVGSIEVANVIRPMKRRALAQTIESSAVHVLDRRKTRLVMQTTSVESPSLLGRSKSRVLTRAVESSTCVALARRKSRQLVMLVENDAAQPFAGGAITRPVALVTSSEIARPIDARRLTRPPFAGVTSPPGGGMTGQQEGVTHPPDLGVTPRP